MQNSRLPPAPARDSVKMQRQGYHIEPSQGDGWKIVSPHGHIDYRHVPDGEGNTNEIWWVESHKPGHGSHT